MAAPFAPMLATAGEAPTGAGWRYEFKWDGVRLLADWDGSDLRFWTRNGNDASAAYPELQPMAAHLGPEAAILDGEVVVLDEHNRPDFGLLQHRMHVRSASEAAQLTATHPVQFFAFDVVRFGGHDVRALPWSDRRDLLERLELTGPSWRVPPVFDGPADDVLAAAERLGLEGVVAKRVDAAYEPGRRTSAWRKLKLVRRDEFVVGGFTAGDGRRSASFGALLLGVYDDGRLRYVGSVGTGFDDAELGRLRRRLDPMVITDDPFELGPDRPTATFVRPELVAEVVYGEWTRDQVLRHPSYAGMRTDRRATDVEVPGPVVDRGQSDAIDEAGRGQRDW